MKQISVKVLSLALSFIMLASMAVVPASAAENNAVDSGEVDAVVLVNSHDDRTDLPTNSGSAGYYTKWSLYDDGNLYIYGNGRMNSYANTSSSGIPWNTYKDKIKSITIESGVTSIGAYAFADCAVKNVSIAQSVTSIENGAFSNCTKLDYIDIPISVTQIGDYAFMRCSSLDNVRIKRCTKTIGSFAFSDCTAIKKLTVDDGVQEIGELAFQGCVSLKSAALPNSIESIGKSAFGSCKALENVSVPNGLTEIADNTFQYCEKLLSVTIPSSVNTIGSSAFENCTSLKEITFNGNKPTMLSLLEIDYPFYGVKAHVSYPENDSTWDNIENTWDGGGEMTFGTFYVPQDNPVEPNKPEVTDNIPPIIDYQNDEFDLVGKVFIAVSGKGYIHYKDQDNLIVCYNNKYSICTPTERKAKNGSFSMLIGSTRGNWANIAYGSAFQGRINSNYYWSITLTDQVGSRFLNDDFYLVDADQKRDERLSLLDCYTCELNQSITVTATYRSSEAPKNISFSCENNQNGSIKFGNIKGVGSMDNEWWITASLTSNKVGKYIITCNVGEYSTTAILYVVRVNGDSIEIYDPDDYNANDSYTLYYPDDTEYIIYPSKSKTIAWESGKYTQEEINADLRIENKKYSNGTGGNLNIDSVKFELTKLPMFEIEGSPDITTPFTLAPGETKTIQIKLKKKGLFWKKPDNTDDIDGYISAYIKGSKKDSQIDRMESITVTYHNEELKKKQVNSDDTEYIHYSDKEIEEELSKFTIGWNEGGFHNVGFTDAEIEAVEYCAKVWTLQIYSTISIVKSDPYYKKILDKIGDELKEKYNELVLEALGCRSDLFDAWMVTKLTSQNANADTIVEIPHNGVNYQVHINLNIDSYAFEDDNAYAGFGTISYYITDMKGQRVDQSLTSGKGYTGVLTQTDIMQFRKSVESVAKQSVENIYSNSIAKAIDKKIEKFCKQINKNDKSCLLVKALTSDVTDYIVKKKLGSYSNNIFKLKAKKIENFYKKSIIKCPVDVYIYNSQNELCGSVVNNVPAVYCEDISIEVVEDEKYVYYPADDDYRFELIGNDSGTMNYDVLTYSENGELLRKREYTNIPLENGLGYTSVVSSNPYSDMVTCNPISYEGDILTYTSDSYLDEAEPYIQVEGVVIDNNDIQLTVGESSKIQARVQPDNAYNQCLRYVSSDESVATVSLDGMIKGISLGETTIAVISEDGEYQRTVNVVVVSDESDIDSDKSSDTKKDTDSDKSSDTKKDTDSDKSTDTKKDTDSDQSSDTKKDTDSDQSSDTKKDTDSDKSTDTKKDTDSDQSSDTKKDTDSDKSIDTKKDTDSDTDKIKTYHKGDKVNVDFVIGNLPNAGAFGADISYNAKCLNLTNYKINIDIDDGSKDINIETNPIKAAFLLDDSSVNFDQTSVSVFTLTFEVTKNCTLDEMGVSRKMTSLSQITDNEIKTLIGDDSDTEDIWTNIKVTVNCTHDTDKESTPTLKGIIGDLDVDGKITSADSLLILRQSVSLEHFTDFQQKLADVDGDGKITSADALEVLRYSVSLPTTGNIGKTIKKVT